jgi:ribonuclease D
VKTWGIEAQSLQKIYALLFGKKISKSQRLTNWEADVLTDRQKGYAATDAWACIRIYKYLEELKAKGGVKVKEVTPKNK